MRSSFVMATMKSILPSGAFRRLKAGIFDFDCPGKDNTARATRKYYITKRFANAPAVFFYSDPVFRACSAIGQIWNGSIAFPAARRTPRIHSMPSARQRRIDMGKGTLGSRSTWSKQQPFNSLDSAKPLSSFLVLFLVLSSGLQPLWRVLLGQDTLRAKGQGLDFCSYPSRSDALQTKTEI